jgi:hypothetical protein
MTQDMEKEPILQMGSDKMIPRHVYDKFFAIRLSDRSEWKKWFQPDIKGVGQMVPRQKRHWSCGVLPCNKEESLS